MSNVIAVIWDFDRTLIDGYMQDPIFADYDVDPAAFWKEVNAMPAAYAKQGVFADRIVGEEREKIARYTLAGVPRHLTE